MFHNQLCYFIIIVQKNIDTDKIIEVEQVLKYRHLLILHIVSYNVEYFLYPLFISLYMYAKHIDIMTDHQLPRTLSRLNILKSLCGYMCQQLDWTFPSHIIMIVGHIKSVLFAFQIPDNNKYFFSTHFFSIQAVQ